jgi:hypothetical protein
MKVQLAQIHSYVNLTTDCDDQLPLSQGRDAQIGTPPLDRNANLELWRCGRL